MLNHSHTRIDNYSFLYIRRALLHASVLSPAPLVHTCFSSSPPNKDTPILFLKLPSNSNGLRMTMTETTGSAPLLFGGDPLTVERQHDGGQKYLRRTRAAEPVCVIRPAVVIHHVRMFASLVR